MTMKPYKGIGMNGAIAKWYASNTRKFMSEFNALARRVADEVPVGAHVLEVAPGPGYFSVELARLGRQQVTGLDISKTFVEIASKNAAQAGVPAVFQVGNASAMPFPSQSFDFILCRAAFKNFTEPVRAIEEMYRVLKPGGRALIIDLRGDASVQSIEQEIDKAGVGAFNRSLNKLIFRFMLLKRAYTKKQFEQFVAQTGFRKANIKEFPMSFEVEMQKNRE